MPKNSDAARRAKSRNEPNTFTPVNRGDWTGPGKARKKAKKDFTTEEVAAAALKLKPAAAYLGGLSVPTMHRLMQRGLLRPNRSTRHLLFLRSELERFLKDGMT